MATTKVFQSGNSQAVRIPREFQFDVAEVEIERHGDAIVLRPLARNLMAAFDALADMPDDFLSEGRQDTPPQTRKGL
ncbi:MAG: type II toxin-antitoxin system VapB family antitoxin [Thiobacillus sp.]